MKLTAILLFTACMAAGAAGNSQTVTLTVKDAPLKKVFLEIQRQTGYNIMVDEALIANAKKVSLKVKQMPVEEVLTKCLDHQGLSFTILENAIVIKGNATADLQTAESSLSHSPPPIDIRGRIINENGEPVAATVMVKGTKIGTTTNSNGEFQLTGIDEDAVLVISGVSIEPMEIAVAKNPGLKSGGGLTISAKTEITTLNEVVINKGYYKTNRITEVGNVSTVTAKEIEKSPVTNVLLAMQGRVPGMEITPANGLPGSGVTVRIRGQNSFENGNDPLYVIDGVPYGSQMLPGLSNNPILGSSGGYGPQRGSMSGSPLSYLNPGDIESIDILKDADATAIYGTRGANGVVLITTKKGKPGPLRFDVNVQYGLGKVTRFVDWLNTREYLDMRYEAYKNDGVSLPSTPGSSNYDLTVWDTTRYTDWNKELIGGTAKFTNIQLSLFGGTDNARYRIGYNYNKQTTVYPGSFGDPKGTLSFSLSSTSNNKKFNTQLSGTYQVDNNSLLNYDLSGYTNLAPNAPKLYNDDGSLHWAPNPLTGFETWQNPLAYLTTKYKRKVNNLVSNAILSYQILPDLEFKTSAGYTSIQSFEVRTNPLTLYSPFSRPFYERSSQFSTSQSNSWIVEPQFTFNKRIAKGNLKALIGSTIQQTESQGQSIDAKGFNSDLVLEDIKAATSVSIVSTLDAKYKYNAVFARLNYDWDEKYLLNITARRDGTSRFGPDKQFANFGAVGLGWIFSKENFISNALPFLSFGKLRASYGVTGSDQVGDYRYLNLYSYRNYTVPYQNSQSLTLNGLYNADLAWEETKKIEMGTELGFFSDRIYVIASYFRNRSSNQLTSYQLPSSTGATSIAANLEATVANTGWEFSIKGTSIQSKHLRWNSTVNLSVPKNKLISIDSGAYFMDKRLLGQSLSTQFVYSYGGVDPATGQYWFIDNKGLPTFKPDSAFVANTHPLNTATRWYGGIQNSISWNGIQLDFLFHFVKQIGVSNERGNSPGSFFAFNQPTSVLDHWQKPGDISLVQRFYQNSSSSFNDANLFLKSSDGIWTDASYVRLKNISLSWQLPVHWVKKMGGQNARIYAQGQNLFTITNYKGSDPETRSLTSLPPLRVWTMGVQLTF